MENIYAYENETYRRAKIPENGKINPFVAIFGIIKIAITLTLMSLGEPFLNLWLWIRYRKKLDNIVGKIALVTGGANGLGRALAIRLAQEKCHIAIADLNQKEAEKTASEISNLYGVNVKAFKVDVSDVKSVQKLKDEIESSLGSVDILVNNAGILPIFSLRDCPDEDVQRLVDVNLMSHIWTVRTFIDGMIKRKYGRIIGISGLAAKLTTPYGTLYNVTKIGIKAFMECLYEELFAMKLENQIRTVTAFPYYLATRQELMDLLEGNKLFFGVITPEEAADKIIVGMLEHKMDITIPSFLNQIAWIYRNLLPRRTFKYAKSLFGWPVEAVEEVKNY